MKIDQRTKEVTLTEAEYYKLVNSPVSEELEKALANEWKGYIDRGAATVDALEDNTQELAFAKGFYRGAKWQEYKLEKNRLSACDKQTEEEAEIERDFVMCIIEKEHRQPTFDDAIKYGMRLQKEQMMKEAVDGQVVKAYTGLFRFSSDEISNDDIKKMNLKFGDKVKLIII